MNERLKQFDLLKGIGIICVLLGHTVISGFPKELIYGFHMPLFFFCSGVFFKNRSLRETLLNNIRQLLVPYIFFLLILGISYFFVNIISGNSLSESFSHSISNFDFFDEGSKAFLSIWFLLCLFIVKVLYAVIYKLSNNVYVNLFLGGGGILLVIK